ncbi:hypothetical protein Poli38472_011000 [Pythium oligandrum]|uniref:Protein kinase domain-containing protein n=1 Tax=Pythium oligandrum TaxID=41045 RepID=A0A8K1FJL5_PYTOL|nr:hypothetical protein Poli38472_011000 [Pythium oligandrum]|eukprot:TMW61937.1 hypothetical protein Poli38472_011000 [Pythium oligandrum]
MLYQAALGLIYLHKKHIVHGNLSSAKLLVTEQGDVKLFGFGATLEKQNNKSNALKSDAREEFSAPECIGIDPNGAYRGDRHSASFESDVYSFGLTIVEAIVKRDPFAGMTLQDIRILKQSSGFVQPAEMSDDAWTLVEQMCLCDPRQRVALGYVAEQLRRTIRTEEEMAFQTSTLAHPDTVQRPRIHDMSESGGVQTVADSVRPASQNEIFKELNQMLVGMAGNSKNGSYIEGQSAVDTVSGPVEILPLGQVPTANIPEATTTAYHQVNPQLVSLVSSRETYVLVREAVANAVLVYHCYTDWRIDAIAVIDAEEVHFNVSFYHVVASENIRVDFNLLMGEDERNRCQHGRHDKRYTQALFCEMREFEELLDLIKDQAHPLLRERAAQELKDACIHQPNRDVLRSALSERLAFVVQHLLADANETVVRCGVLIILCFARDQAEWEGLRSLEALCSDIAIRLRSYSSLRLIGELVDFQLSRMAVRGRFRGTSPPDDYVSSERSRADDLLKAAGAGNIKAMERLDQGGTDLSFRSKDDRIALLSAAENGNVQVVRYLVERGIGIDTSYNNGKTVLLVAAENGHLEVVRYLMEQGAGTQCVDSDGNSVLHVLLLREDTKEIDLLPLVKLLLERGLSPLTTNQKGLSPKSIASSKQFLRVVTLIEEFASRDERSWFIPYDSIAKVGHAIAHGGFGSVYLAKWQHTDIVIKEFSDIEQHRFMDEVEVWSQLNHPNVVQFYGANHRDEPRFIVSMYASKGGLVDYLKHEKEQGRDVTWRKLKEVAVGLSLYASARDHSLWANIVVSSDGTAMLIDFGLSFFESDSDPWVKNIEDTLDAWAWRAPEYPNLSVETPTRKSDVYSLGMVIIEAVTGRCPWSEHSDTEIREFLRAGVSRQRDECQARKWPVGGERLGRRAAATSTELMTRREHSVYGLASNGYGGHVVSDDMNTREGERSHHGAEDEDADGQSTRNDSASESSSTAHRRRKRSAESSASSSDTERNAASIASKQPRKPTYLVRKEEKELLVEEIRLLESRLELLKVRAGLPTQSEEKSLAHTVESNATITDAIHTQLLQISSVQSLVARHLHELPVNPMSMFIYLSKNLEERRTTLRGIRESKFQRAISLVQERMRFLDESKPYFTEERYVTDDGAYHCKRFEIQQFEGLESVKQLYDTLRYYLSNMEISISEMLGHVTIRENMDSVDPQIWNHRLVSSSVHGLIMEMNSVGFAEYYEQYAPMQNQEFAVVAADTVDADELYPYVPEARVRRDATVAITMNSYRSPDTLELVVVLKRCTFLKLHPPQFPLQKEVLEELRANISTWSNVMSTFLVDTVRQSRRRQQQPS